ncbi:MAG TPA: DNA-formamidopyrimidine glycosylase family protein [Candidatus Limnocylindrales bacterium]|nr:DNA-formamidopyrimidine glycosylase family protein [Candidatus Limnocylindrales bacterium]
MPELPDLAILADALHAGLAGRPLEQAVVHEPLVVRGTPAEIRALAGQRLHSVTRRGKFLTFALERDRLVVNAMLSGRLGLAGPDIKPWPKAAAALSFAPRTAEAAPAAAWLAEADWLPPSGSPIELRYRDATRMGKLYVLPAGIERSVAGFQEQGPDADDPALTLDEWRRRIGRHSGELKNLLRNQAFVAGIGNAYSDEILWTARLAPYRTRASLTAEEVDALYEATGEVMAWAIAALRQLVPPRLEVEQRGFLSVHAKGGQPCPRCGTPISSVKAGGSETNFCRSCQR